MSSNKRKAQPTLSAAELEQERKLLDAQCNDIVIHITNINDALQRNDLKSLIVALRDFGLYRFESLQKKGQELDESRLNLFIPKLKSVTELHLPIEKLSNILYTEDATKNYMMEIGDEADLSEESLLRIVWSGLTAYKHIMIDSDKNTQIQDYNRAQSNVAFSKGPSDQKMKYEDREKEYHQNIDKFLKKQEDKITDQLKALISKMWLQKMKLVVKSTSDDKKSVEAAGFHIDNETVLNSLLCNQLKLQADEKALKKLEDTKIEGDDDLIVSTYISVKPSKAPILSWDRVKIPIIEHDRELIVNKILQILRSNDASIMSLKNKLLLLNIKSSDNALELIKRSTLLNKLMNQRFELLQRKGVMSEADFNVQCEAVLQKVLIENDCNIIAEKIKPLNLKLDEDVRSFIANNTLLRTLMNCRENALKKGQEISEADFSKLCDMVLQVVSIKLLADEKQTTNPLKLEWLPMIEGEAQRLLSPPLKPFSEIYQNLYHTIFSARQAFIGNVISKTGHLIRAMGDVLTNLDRLYFKSVFRADPPVSDSNNNLSVKYEKFMEDNYSRLTPAQFAAIRGIVSYVQSILKISPIKGLKEKKGLEDKLLEFFSLKIPEKNPADVTEMIFQLLRNVNQAIADRDKKSERFETSVNIARIVQLMRFPTNVLLGVTVDDLPEMKQEALTPKQRIKRDLEEIMTIFEDTVTRISGILLPVRASMEDSPLLYMTVGQELEDYSFEITLSLTDEARNSLKDRLFRLSSEYLKLAKDAEKMAKEDKTAATSVSSSGVVTTISTRPSITSAPSTATGVTTNTASASSVEDPNDSKRRASSAALFNTAAASTESPPSTAAATAARKDAKFTPPKSPRK